MPEPTPRHSFHVVIEESGNANVKMEGIPQKIADGLLEAARKDKAIDVMLRYVVSTLIKEAQ